MSIEEDYIKNNTRFIKPKIRKPRSLFIQNVVFLTSDNLEQNLQALIAEEDINTIRLTDDYKLDNLDFIKDYNLGFIRSIDILSDSIKDIEGLYGLTNLEKINSINQKIDYTRFLKLKSIAGELSSFSYKTLANLTTLESISISNKFRESDISIFLKNSKLKSLELRGSKITSLKGLENFREIKYIGLFHNRSITSLEGIIEEHDKCIKEISIYAAPKLIHVDKYLSKHSNIEHLHLACKKVDSFKFLNGLNNLKLLSIHNKLVDVEDGNKEPLIHALERTGSKIW